MSTPETGGKTAPTAARIRLLRSAMNYESAAAFAGHLGITPSRLSNLENGLPLSIEVAQLIVKKIPGSSLDWLYNGREEGLSTAMLRKLQEAAPGKGKTRTTSKPD